MILATKRNLIKCLLLFNFVSLWMVNLTAGARDISSLGLLLPMSSGLWPWRLVACQGGAAAWVRRAVTSPGLAPSMAQCSAVFPRPGSWLVRLAPSLTSSRTVSRLSPLYRAVMNKSDYWAIICFCSPSMRGVLPAASLVSTLWPLATR